MTDRPLPPLAAIRAFDAAARRGSFSVAAGELGMTQAAVSYQIKQLEDRVGAPLFRRHARGVRLTDAGKRLATASAEALDILRDGFAEACGEAEETLAISALATFATLILAPRIGKFQMANPGIATRIQIDHDLVDLLGGEATVGIRGGNPPWPGLHAEFLMHAEYTVVVAPSLIERCGPIETPVDILKFPFVEPADPSWANWFRAAGIPLDRLPESKGYSFGSQLLEGKAITSGHGIGLLTPVYAREGIDRGHLVQPFDIVSRDDLNIWLVYPERRKSSRAIRAFRDWIRGEMAELGYSAEMADATGPPAVSDR